MAITATCPGCGATLSIAEDQTSVTCQFCGNHFNVNLDETAPSFEKAEPPPEAPQQPAAADETPTLPGVASQAGADLYNPPIPGASSATQDVYNPPLEDISSGSTQTYSPPPLTGEVEQPLINRIMGNRLWVGIAIAVMVIFCISCLCMVAIARGIFK